MPTPTLRGSSDDDVTLSLPHAAAESFRQTVADLIDGIDANGSYRTLSRDELQEIATAISERGDVMVTAPQTALTDLVNISLAGAVDSLSGDADIEVPTSTIRHHLTAIRTWTDVIDAHDWLSKPAAVPAFTLLIPQRFVRLFRKGVEKSTRSDIGALSAAVDRKNPRAQVGDLESGAAQLPESIALLKAVPELSSTDVTIDDPSPSAAAQAFESMAREVCGPLLENVLGVGPYEENVVAEIEELTRAIDWAAERAVACHDQAAKVVV